MVEGMNREGLLALYVYNARAVQMVLDVVDQVTHEEFTREFSPSHGSVRGLLVHSMAAEARFLAACQGHELNFDPGHFDRREEIRAYWDGLEQRVQRYLRGAEEHEMQRPVEITIRGQALRLPVWQLLAQAFVHAAHHRGELSILLTELGHPLPTLDIIIHFVEQSGQAWPGR